MTTVITRLYSDSSAAGEVVTALQAAGFPDGTYEMLSADVGVDSMVAARIPARSAEIYAGELTGAMALVVVRAPFTPFGAARKAMAIVDSVPAVRSAVFDENVLLNEEIDPNLTKSILTHHPRFFTRMDEITSKRGGLVSTGLGWKILSDRKPRRSAQGKQGFKSSVFWPMPLLKEHKNKKSVYPGGKKFLTS